MADRYYIRIGTDRGTGGYVKTYAGGNVTTTRRRRYALYWKDRDLAMRLVVAIREIEGVSARVTVMREKAEER